MPTVAGWIETVTFPDQGITLDAKLDTGAVSASLSVTDLERFKRKGKTWYRFTMRGADGKTATVEQQTSRLARVMRAEVKDTLRPIVRLKVCVAGHEAVTDFNLTDRSSQEYPGADRAQVPRLPRAGRFQPHPSFRQALRRREMT